ncbi:hypothetical protein [Pelobium manganitolerans]|uniref:hypothetical protein n=1 Tax=Pelobium manganitolerans TaxID=1842495 RepID=UPI003FA39E64
MKQNKTKLALVAKLFGGLCLVALLVFNVTAVVNKQSSSGLSLSSLINSADAQGEGGGITCAAVGTYGPCLALHTYSCYGGAPRDRYSICQFTGYQFDNCEQSEQIFCD